MQLTSSATNMRFSLKRVAAPEKVNATIKPNRAKTAPSTVPSPPRSPSDSFWRRLTPKRRPISSISSMPMRRSRAKRRGGMGGSMRALLMWTHSDVSAFLDHSAGRLWLESNWRPADALRFKVDSHLNAVRNLNEGNTAVHPIVLAVEGHCPVNLARAGPRAEDG